MAIAGGGSQGMEVWNPLDGSVTSLTAELPPEEDDNNGLEFAELMPIKGGKELLLYGGNMVGYIDQFLNDLTFFLLLADKLTIHSVSCSWI